MKASKSLTVPKAEKLAITFALKISHKLPGKVVIFSDCIGAITASRKLNRNNVPITYVPAHVGIVGNEAADRLAKYGTAASMNFFSQFWEKWPSLKTGFEFNIFDNPHFNGVQYQ